MDSKEALKKRLGMRMRLARNTAGLTQPFVARKLKVKQATVSLWECGRNEPDVFTLARLAQLYSVPLPWFFGQGQALTVGTDE